MSEYMKMVFLSCAIGVAILSVASCKSETKEQKEETAVEVNGIDKDSKQLADLTCKTFELMMSGKGITPEGMPTDEFVKLSTEVENLTKEMESKYKASVEWAKFEKATQELVDKCEQ